MEFWKIIWKQKFWNLNFKIRISENYLRMKFLKDQIFKKNINLKKNINFFNIEKKNELGRWHVAWGVAVGRWPAISTYILQAISNLIKLAGSSSRISFLHVFILILNFICYLKYSSNKPIFHPPTPCGALGPSEWTIFPCLYAWRQHTSYM